MPGTFDTLHGRVRRHAYLDRPSGSDLGQPFQQQPYRNSQVRPIGLGATVEVRDDGVETLGTRSLGFTGALPRGAHRVNASNLALSTAREPTARPTRRRCE